MNCDTTELTSSIDGSGLTWSYSMWSFMPILAIHLSESSGGTVVTMRAFLGYSAWPSAPLPKLMTFGMRTVCMSQAGN